MEKFLFLCLFFVHQVYSLPTEYNVGVGMADITGPAAEVNMMGYANPAQVAGGIHLRSFSRAFIFVDPENQQRVVYVNLDACMLSEVIKLEVIKQLDRKYPGVYTVRNVLISGTHTHSAAGGFHQYVLYDVTSLGFVPETYQAMVDGIVKSIERAHDNIQPANLYVNTGELLESNINRSPSAYLLNPETERAKYQYNVDKNMTVLKIVDANENPIGMISWFAVHCTSMNNTNHLLSSDNKGYASLLFEEAVNGKHVLPGKGKFVAAFGQSNEGDVSPNTKGPHCLDTGKACDVNTSTCNNRNEMCVAFGPGKDMFESTKIIGENQFKKAMELFDSAIIPVSGPVDFRHTYTKMSEQTVAGGKKTCKPAMGYSFAAGTTDGPGAFDFKQGTTTPNKFWTFVSDLIKHPTPEQVACHKPKPILLDTGEITFPYEWEPTIVDTQLLRLGQLFIIAVPAEFTTMSGRRTRDAVAKSLLDAGFPEQPIPVISGLANDYADYVTTFEEYQQQRYEGGSTIYGPHTLEAYIQVFNNLSTAIAKGEPVEGGPAPPNLLSKQLSFLPGVYMDVAGLGNQFGDVKLQPRRSYKPMERVTVKFIGANPRNNRKAESTFLEVQRKQPDSSWVVNATDAHWNTRFYWKSVAVYGESEITVIWDIPADQSAGTYRILYHGDAKSILGDITPFTGTTKAFEVTSPVSNVVSSKLGFVNKADQGKLRVLSKMEQKKKYDLYAKLLEKKKKENIA